MSIVPGVGKAPDYWRLAFIFDAAGGDKDRAANGLVAADGAIREAVQGNDVRYGIAEYFMDEQADQDGHEFSRWVRNDGAIEITVPAAQSETLPAIAQAIKPVLEPLAEPGSVEVMAGPVYFMVPTRPGGNCVLSLSFKRDPATSKEEFSRWWFHQHANVAIPALGEQLMSYDQVHCDADMTRRVSEAYGSEPTYYDAYDNLSWLDREAQVQSTSDEEGMRRIGEDEIGRIDNSSRRHAVLAALSGSASGT